MIQQPDTTHIVVPVGSGGIFIGICEHLQKIGNNITLIGVGVIEKHASKADKLNTPWTPYAEALKRKTKKPATKYIDFLSVQ